MNDMNRLLEKKNRAIKKRKKHTKDHALPVYDMKGKTVFSEQSVRRKKTVVAVVITGLIAVFIYVPQFFLDDDGDSAAQEPEADQSAVRLINSALRDNPTGDFDGDGIENADETTLGTDPWNIDSDGDNVTDYYEVNVLDSDPLSAGSALLDAQTKQDEEGGKNLGTPYKIGNVILWPSDYDSRAYGSVVETLSGYRFCGFDGYAQFPESDGNYAYKVEDGVHTLLPYLEAENAWQVSDGDTVEIYADELEETVKIELFSMEFYAGSGIIPRIASFILPDRGFITATRMMAVDADPDTGKNTTVDIEKPVFNSDDYTRFTMNSNTLNDLQFVRQSISEEGCCIAVSLYNSEDGEYLGIIYGYTAEGNLLVADMDTLEPAGMITVTEMARKLLDNEGDIVSNTYFDFSGFGFDSAKGDRISFFAASEGDGNGDEVNNMLQSEMEEALEETEEQETDTSATDTEDSTDDSGSPAQGTDTEDTGTTTGAGTAGTGQSITDTDTSAGADGTGTGDGTETAGGGSNVVP